MENHADIEIGTKAADAQEQSKIAALSPLFIFYFQSLVAAALLPVVLGSSGGDMVIAVWRLSLLLCAYFYSAVYVLSSATHKGKTLLFVSLTYAASMAFVVSSSPLVGEAGAAVLSWICVLGLAVILGYCLSLYASSDCNTIHGWHSVRSNPKLEPLDKKQAAAAGFAGGAS